MLGACSDDTQPVGARDGTVKLPSTVLQELECTGSAAGISCASASPRLGGASGVIYGGQNVYVRLSSSNSSYDAGTETFSVDVTVQNLMNEAIGTPDGATPDPDGIRVFFSQQPYSTSGAGEVTVANADGTDFFTGANQPFFRYSEILAKDVVSGSKTWQFNKPATVTTFSFKVMIETDVQYLLVVNEVLVNPGGVITDASGEWVELYNAGTREVDLQNLVIADSAASGRRPYHVISSSVVVAPGGYVVLGNTTNTTNNGGVPVDYAYGAALSLVNSLDAFKIARVYGPAADTLTLDRTQFASAAISAQNGISRELLNPALDNSNMDGSNWADALVTAVYGPGGRGTPKAQNSTYTP
ncbi:MAG TPA: lamin tail domain-containing protein [Longimicrobium sp.]|nr:lamin tail domain-containing protein [Longimicrobium sp.]